MTKNEAFLKLIELLTDNRQYTKEDLANRLETTVRNINRYIEELEYSGFDIEKNGKIFSIRLDSPFIKNITKKVRFSGSNLATIRTLLKEADHNNQAVRNLQIQFCNIYGEEVFSGIKFDKQYSQDLDTIYTAIKTKHKVILHGYYSPHGQSKKDRLVEPYKYIMNNDGIRCYEIESGICKNFKLARVTGGIEMLDEKWEYQSKHTNYYTDIFGFSGETLYRVTLRLGLLSSRILCEEYGVDISELAREDDEETHWIFTTKVCNYQGIGRFTLGLLNDIDILSDDKFKAYIRENLAILTQKMASD